MIGGAAAGVMQMFRVLARELGRYGIRLNTVSCGPVAEVDTFVRSNPVDRVGDAGARVLSKLDKRRMFPVAGLDLARTVGFLLADTGDNITGQTWSVNGGLSIVG
jgi:NAD(P)-dependent dehydrogenase (short-subunit alcohol dehydrogenase family)